MFLFCFGGLPGRRSARLKWFLIRRKEITGTACPQSASLTTGIHEPDANGQADCGRDDDSAKDAPYAIPIIRGLVAVGTQRGRLVARERCGKNGFVTIADSGKGVAVAAAVGVVFECGGAVGGGELGLCRARREAKAGVMEVQRGGH